MGLYLVVLSLLLLSSYFEYKSRYRDVLQLIQDQAAMTAAVIAQSGSGQAYLTEELKQSYIDRAIDMLSILNQIDKEQQLSRSDLDKWVNDETIMDISTWDTEGKLEGGTRIASKKDQKAAVVEKAWIQSQLQPILSRQSEIIIIGVDQKQVSSALADSAEDQFLIAIPRDRGGAIACQLSMEAEQNFKYLTAMESALEELLHVKGLQYLKLALDDHEPYFVSKTGEIIDDTWDRQPLADILYTVSKGETKLLEVVRPIFFNTSLGEVRIGFKADTLMSLKSQILYQILIRSTLFSLLAFVLIIFFLVRRNAILLEEEKQRIEAEVYRLEKLNRLREKQAAVGELAAGVAHEIRNPLNAIGIVAQRLKREFSTGKDQQEYELLTGTMVSEISRINSSLQDFLEYTRPTPLSFSTLNMGDFLGSIQELYISEALDKEIVLTIDVQEFEFNADAEYLRQAISNIVRNALDACEGSATVQLRGYKKGDAAIIVVQDTGSGIAQNQISRVFDLYYTTKDMGTGVGLALTHKIIADHHGTIEVTSEIGAGSTFQIELPVKQ
ncbi:MAG: ATP-binding protein [Candidatus Marinimicrobia bacterium]|nr:ATP-binding protein [FCB group bacterium]MBL7026500.1 ATP-binding protein [Candidatus Neomarinimicrobiota bacterium]